MLRNMVTSFFSDERVETTDAKAKELRRVAEKMITLGKRGSLEARRHALAVIRDKKVVKKLFEDIALRYQDRQGGYTRIVKSGHRPGDGALLSVIALTPTLASPDKGKTRTKGKLSKSASKKKGTGKTSPPEGGRGKRAPRKKGPGEG